MALYSDGRFLCTCTFLDMRTGVETCPRVDLCIDTCLSRRVRRTCTSSWDCKSRSCVPACLCASDACVRACMRTDVRAGVCSYPSRCLRTSLASIGLDPIVQDPPAVRRAALCWPCCAASITIDCKCVHCMRALHACIARVRARACVRVFVPGTCLSMPGSALVIAQEGLAARYTYRPRGPCSAI